MALRIHSKADNPAGEKFENPNIINYNLIPKDSMESFFLNCISLDNLFVTFISPNDNDNKAPDPPCTGVVLINGCCWLKYGLEFCGHYFLFSQLEFDIGGNWGGGNISVYRCAWSDFFQV